jgi:hypothetical protein
MEFDWLRLIDHIDLNRRLALVPIGEIEKPCFA